ncbi:recombinase family protein [Clostridium tyrobutyricum]|uniref:recombinase family protein n=1 Tax=Clostridium tyrobutyricum TaxID=1519 RepID=UPI002B21F2FA|nr:recombinase family protein [Clostridium tyrobutyricum]MEA5009063.1 recombinase family protein [Clostridium tyrobutyricum]
MDILNEKTYNAAIYVRLSRDDGDKEESDSILNQKELIREYLKKKSDINICSIKVDDGYSGVDFNRPAFLEMMEDIKAGKINCVVVKDLSRFGRNYIESGKYIQKVFPFLGVRFIAINDNYDSAEGSTITDNIMIPFKNLINDSYCRDSSIKIRSQLEVKRKKGDFIGSFAAYGYKKSGQNKNKLEIDEYAASIVRDIFKWKLEGMSQQGIANKLNQMGILSPMEYKRSLGERYKTTFKVKQQALWSAVAVRRILTNELYIGILEQGKRTTPNYKIKTRIERPKEEWVRVENSHEPIISKELFATVNSLLLHDTRIAPNEETVYLFSGIIACGDCRENMIRKTVPAKDKKYYYYTCSTNRYDKSSCTTHSISEKAFEEAVLLALNVHITSILDIERILNYIDTLPYRQDEILKLDAQIVKAQEELEKFQRYKLISYEHFVDKEITKEEYQEHVKRYNAKIMKAEKLILDRKQEIENIISNKTLTNLWIEHFKKYKNIEKLTRKIVVSLIEKIYVYENGKIDIHFRYQAEYENALRFIDSASKSESFNANAAFKEVI